MKSTLRAEALIQKLVAGIDEMVTEQLCAIIQHPRFKALESLWRGLLYMRDAVPAVAPVRVRLLDMSWAELSDDLNLSARVQTTVLFRLVNREELNTLGG
ncbi:type VI secretion system contractile sheath domain-containing protein, partial [Endozoicomonas sp.]|uniref:type VI secretion system contractile sheath domain-containing protein n=1 Tax=Endozoicomonas sp. TaxID=1892382 RepID=UPI00383BB709